MSSNVLPPIKGFIRNTLVDWEGQIACAIFLPGCNFRCPYCHARALVAEADCLPSVPISGVMEYLAKNRGWVDAVVISGGEPMIQPDLEQLIVLLRSAKVLVKLDTNGSRPDLLRRFIERKLVDFVAMDVKAPLDERYGLIAGPALQLGAIRSSIKLLMEGAVEYEFRTTVCPRFLGQQDVVDLARALAGARRLVLQPFRPVDCLDTELEAVEPYPRATLRQMAQAASQFVPCCSVRGDFQSERGAVLREA